MEEGEILFESNKKSQHDKGDVSALRCPMEEIELLFESNNLLLKSADFSLGIFAIHYELEI